MTQSMKDAAMGTGGGLQSISGSVAETMSNSMDTRNKGQKGSDEASTSLHGMGKSAGPTVEGTNVKATDQVANQSSGGADHLELGMRKQT